MKKYVIGLDYGTDSVRAVLIDTENGSEITSSVSYYQRWKEGNSVIRKKTVSSASFRPYRRTGKTISSCKESGLRQKRSSVFVLILQVRHRFL
jgi:ribulose kinase